MSAVRVGYSLHRTIEGVAIRIPVLVVNKGLVTAPLHAVLLRPTDAVIDISFSGPPLSGASNEERELELRPAISGPLDITIAFEISLEGGDLAGRDRVHMLLKASQN